MKLPSWARNDFHFWRSILIALVLILLPFSSYSTAATSWQPFGAGWEVLNSGSSATYRFNGAERLFYNSSSGQWSQKGQLDGGTWSNLGNAGQSATFIGDGAAHSIGSGWSYMYNGSNARKQDSAWFSLNGTYRLAYNYTDGQWWQKGTDWSKVGSAGLSAAFIGDGTDRSIGGGWSYMYNGSNARKQDSAWFSINGTYRLAYNYTEGQWWQKGVDWSKVGSAGLSTAFIGDGTDRSIGGGWSYMYNGSNARKQDSAWFSLNGTYRLAYNYTEGQWWQKGIDWSKVGSVGLSTSFIGDGSYHDLKNGWSYSYLSSGDEAQWKDGSALRFAYAYNGGQWSHYGYTGGWQSLGASGQSSAFVGDGSVRSIDLGNAWSYKYEASTDKGYWKYGDQPDFRLAYYYNNGRWDHGRNETWATLTTGVGAQFWGDGQQHMIDGNWRYSYHVSLNAASWWRNGDPRFQYQYGLGQWDHRYGMPGLWNPISTGMAPTFIGNGAWHDLNAVWTFRYAVADEMSYWRRISDSETDARFRYRYNSNSPSVGLYGDWSEGRNGVWRELATEINLYGDDFFIGDGNRHDRLLNNEPYLYDVSTNIGYYGDHVMYRYSSGEWLHGSGGHWFILDAGSGFEVNLLDGAKHSLAGTDRYNGWTYQYLGDYLSFWYRNYVEVTPHFSFWYNYNMGKWALGSNSVLIENDLINFPGGASAMSFRYNSSWIATYDFGLDKMNWRWDGLTTEYVTKGELYWIYYYTTGEWQNLRTGTFHPGFPYPPATPPAS